MPRGPLNVVRLLSGLALGLLVWLWVFSPAGAGGFGGLGGWWPFGGKGGSAVSSSAAKDSTEKQAERAPPPAKATGTQPPVLRS